MKTCKYIISFIWLAFHQGLYKYFPGSNLIIKDSLTFEIKFAELNVRRIFFFLVDQIRSDLPR